MRFLLAAAVLAATMTAGAQPPAVVKNVTVYREKGRFGGWPAERPCRPRGRFA